MKRTTTAILLGLGILLGSAPALANNEVGNFQPIVSTQGVSQSNSGSDNKNKLEVGTVKMKTGKSMGNFQPIISTQGISQSNSGSKNKNEIKIGTVE